MPPPPILMWRITPGVDARGLKMKLHFQEPRPGLLPPVTEFTHPVQVAGSWNHPGTLRTAHTQSKTSLQSSGSGI